MIGLRHLPGFLRRLVLGVMLRGDRYDFVWRFGLPVHVHPDYGVRSGLSVREYGDWIEGLLRRHPGYSRTASVAANEFAMSVMDGSRAEIRGGGTEAEISDALHEAYRLGQATVARGVPMSGADIFFIFLDRWGLGSAGTKG